jgi:hypothetical protein
MVVRGARGSLAKDSKKYGGETRRENWRLPRTLRDEFNTMYAIGGLRHRAC